MRGNSGLRTRKLVNDELVRSVVSPPRRIPRRKREEIVARLAEELVGETEGADIQRSRGRFGLFHVIMTVLRGMDGWNELRALSAGSDVIATLSLRSMSAVVLDVLDGTLPLQGSPRLQGLGALTLAMWRDRVADGPAILSRGVEELESSPGAVDDHEALATLLHPHLSDTVRVITARSQLLSMLRDLLPSGGDEAFVEEVFLEQIQDVERLAKLLKRSREMQQIIDLMGKLDVEYGSKQDRVQSFHTYEAYDLEQSKEVRYVLPVELLKLEDPTLRLVFFSKMLEGELLTYQLKGLNWMEDPDNRKGPIIALIDASGSMSGPPEVLAKAFLMMLAKRMEREGRDIKVILFAAQDWKLEINLVDRRRVARNLLDIIGRPFEGGTDFNSALRVGLETVSEGRWKGADVLLFTDGESTVSDRDLVASWTEFKRRTGSKVYTLIVNNTSAGGLEMVSDRVWTLPMGTWSLDDSPSNIIKLIAGE